jgi:hypothetical protein
MEDVGRFAAIIQICFRSDPREPEWWSWTRRLACDQGYLQLGTAQTDWRFRRLSEVPCPWHSAATTTF